MTDTLQDILSGIALMAFVIVAGAYLAGFAS